MGIYSSIINSTESTLLTETIKIMQPEIDRVVAQREKANNEGFHVWKQWDFKLDKEVITKIPNRIWTAWDRECEATFLIYDLTKSLCKYAKPTDKVDTIKTGISNRGNYQVAMTLIRDGETYNLTTDVIYAGGYNIKCLHTRYLTKSDLPRVSEKPLEQVELETEVKARKKISKLEKDVQNWSTRIENTQKEIDEALLKSDEEIREILIEEKSYLRGDWNNLSEYGQKNYGTPENYKAEMEKSMVRNIESWKNQHIFYPTRNVEGLKKYLAKDLAKIEKVKETTPSLNK